MIEGRHFDYFHGRLLRKPRTRRGLEETDIDMSCGSFPLLWGEAVDGKESAISGSFGFVESGVAKQDLGIQSSPSPDPLFYDF